MKITLGNLVRVGDPCYDEKERDNELNAIFKAKPGVWNIEVEKVQSFGDRVSVVTLNHSQMERAISSGTFELGVDSGQMAFESADTVRGGEYDEMGTYYAEACKTTLDERGEGYGIFTVNGKECFVTSSGYGDGCYRLDVAYNDNGEAISIEMTFIDEKEEEEEEECCEFCGYSDCRGDCNDDEEEEEGDDEE